MGFGINLLGQRRLDPARSLSMAIADCFGRLLDAPSLGQLPKTTRIAAITMIARTSLCGTGLDRAVQSSKPGDRSANALLL